MSGPARVTNLKGDAGGEYIADTNAHTGDFDTIIAHEAAVASITCVGVAGTLSAVVLPVGVPFFARKITSITLASGKVMAYNRI